jgi:hypothetical protein
MATQNVNIVGQGNYEEWAGFGSNYLHVDDPIGSPDDNTTTISIGGSVVKRDCYTLSSSDIDNIGSGDTINKVTVHFRCKGDSTSCTIRAMVRYNSVDGDSSNQSLTTSWVSYSEDFANDPESNAWTRAKLYNTEIGVVQIAAGFLESSYCTQVYCVIDYTSGDTELTKRIAMDLILEAETDKRLAHKVALAVQKTTRLAHGASVDKEIGGRLAMSVPFIGLFIPNANGDYSGAWTYNDYTNVDDPPDSPDDETTKLYTIDSGQPYTTFRNSSNYVIPNGSSIRIRTRVRKSGVDALLFKIILRKNSTNYLSDSDISLSTSWITRSFTWTIPPWGDSDWGNLQDLYFGLVMITDPTSYYLFLTQTYLEVVPPTTLTERIAHGATVEKVDAARLSHGVSFEEYPSPDWWDNAYFKRAQLSFGTAHSALEDDTTVNFNIFTGYEKKLPKSNALTNESIQHSSRQIVEYNNKAYLFWLGKNDSNPSQMDIWVVVYDFNTETWGTPHDICYSGNSTGDAHYYPWPIVDSSGYFYIFYGCHDSALKFRKTNNAEDITSWTSKVSIGSSLTYPRAVVTDLGDLYVFARYGYEYYAYYKSTDGGLTWGDRHTVVDYSANYGGIASCYCGGIQYKNGRFHIVITFWDWYRGVNKGRAIDYFYSDDFENWYEKDGTRVGETDNDPITFADITPVVSSGDGSWPNPPIYHTNSEALVIDSYGRPYFLYQEWNTVIGEECDLWIAKWSGSAWSLTDLSALSGSPQMARYRQGSVLYLDLTDRLFVYAFAWPATAEEQFGGELYVWVGDNYGATWGHQYLSANSAYGIGQINVLPEPRGAGRLLFINRCADLFLFVDKNYPYIQVDGDDLRIIRHQYHNAAWTDTELDRLPDFFQNENSAIYFMTDLPTPANMNYPHAHGRYFVYFSNPAATSAPHDIDNIWTFYDSFESYASGSNLNGQGGWTVTGSSATVISCNDMTYWINAHTNKLWSGKMFLRLTGSTTVAEHSLSLDGHWLDVKMWREGGGGTVYIELYDSVSTNWIRFGMSSQFWYQKSGGSKVYPGITTNSGRYHDFLFRINSSGVSLWGNDELILENDNHITSSTSLKLGREYSGTTCIDDIKSWKWVTDEPETEHGSVEGEDDPGTNRIAHKASLVRTSAARLMHTATLNKFESRRIAHDLILNETDDARLAMSVIPDATLKKRQAHLLSLDKIITERIAQAALIDAGAYERICHYLATDKTLTARLRHDVGLEDTDIERIAEDVDLDKIWVIRLCNIALMNKIDIERMAHNLGLQFVKTVRIMHEIVGDKVVTERLAHVANVAPMRTERIAHFAPLEDTTTARLSMRVPPDKITVERLANWLESNKVLSIRLSHVADIAATDYERLAHYLLTDKTVIARISNEAVLHGRLYERLSQKVTLEAEAYKRLAAYCDLEATGISRISNALELDKITSTRLSMEASLGGKGESRIAQFLELNKIVGKRITNAVPIVAVVLARMAMRADVDKILVARIVHHLTLNAEIEIRLSQLTALETTVTVRLANILAVEYTDTARLSHALDFLSVNTSRISHNVPFYFLVLKGIQLLNQEIKKPDIVNLAMKKPDIINQQIKKADIIDLTIKKPDIINVSFRKPDIQNLEME